MSPKHLRHQRFSLRKISRLREDASGRKVCLRIRIRASLLHGVAQDPNAHTALAGRQQHLSRAQTYLERGHLMCVGVGAVTMLRRSRISRHDPSSPCA